MILNAFFWAAAAYAQAASPHPPTTDGMRQEFLETTSNERKIDLLEKISASAPNSSRDVQALFDLFSRFEDKSVRNAVMASIHRLTPQQAHLETAFLSYLNDKDSTSEIFGINGALSLRSEKALPAIEKLAKQKFPGKGPEDLDLLSEKNEWWVHYEALSALAQLRGASAYPLLKEQASASPAVAAIIGASLWKEAFPDILSWARSGAAADQQRAKLAFSAPTDSRQLRSTRQEMTKIFRNFTDDMELRHQMAIKIGLCSTDEEIAALVKEYGQSKDAELKLLLATSIFASRSLAAAPLLKQYALENPDPTARMGALFELREMLPAEEYLPIVETVAQKDPDPENKEDAQRQVRLLKRDKK